MQTQVYAGVCALVLLASACADEADGQHVEDPSFDTWCGMKLCDWQTDSGRIAATHTWHKRDLAVSFLDTGTQISQRIAPKDVRCFLLDTIADVESEALLYIQANFNDDEVIDFEQQVTAVAWASVPVIVRAPLDFQNVRFIVRKEGTGRAVMAQLRVEPRQRGCTGEPLTLNDGSLCSGDLVCKSGHCFAGRCTSCAGEACTSLAPARRYE